MHAFLRHGSRLVAGAAVVLAALSCGAQIEPSAAVGTEQVQLTLNVTLEQSRLRLEGTTDLPDGALLIYEVRHENWRRAGSREWQMDWRDAGPIEVVNGRFSRTMIVGRWPPGELDVWLSFQTVLGPNQRQPDAVLERFGEAGEHLTGPNVTVTGAGIGVMKSVELVQQVRKET